MAESVETIVCPECGTQIAPALLTCPGCAWLVHADELKKLAAQAEAAEQAKSPTDALTAWRGAQHLLPPDSRQHHFIQTKIVTLSRQVDANPRAAAAASEAFHAAQPKATGQPTQAAGGWRKKGVFGILCVVGVFALTKGKLLLLGLAKLPTLLTMLAALEVYWIAFGWKLALGLVLTTYVHEMGHVAAFRRYGIPVSMPMFLPGISAYVRGKYRPAEPREGARIGLAGPLWGAGAALVCQLLGFFGGWSALTAIGQFTAAINLLNLVPFPPLDGNRGFHALSSEQRLAIALASAGIGWGIYRYVTVGGTFLDWCALVISFCIAAFGLLHLLLGSEQSDDSAFRLYLGLIVALVAMSLLPVSGVL